MDGLGKIWLNIAKSKEKSEKEEYGGKGEIFTVIEAKISYPLPLPPELR